MTRITKILVALTVVNLVAGLLFWVGVLGVGDMPQLYLTFPIGAICYGLFLIWHIMEKETAAFDVEQREHHASAESSGHHESDYGFDHHLPSHA